jgi:hypothetical protein
VYFFLTKKIASHTLKDKMSVENTPPLRPVKPFIPSSSDPKLKKEKKILGSASSKIKECSEVRGKLSSLKGRIKVPERKDSLILPSQIFAKAVLKEVEGKTIYIHSQELEKLIREGGGKDEILQYLNDYNILDHQKAQVLALTKREFRDTDKAFNTLGLLLDTYQKFLPKMAEFGALPGPKEVSLAEGELPSLEPEFREVLVKYLKGEGLASDLGISPSTYKEVLKKIKIFDLELDRSPELRKSLKLELSTNELRTRCLVASEGKMPSFEAYTKSIHPKYFENPFSTASREYASNEENYTPERTKAHAQIAMGFVADMIGLSDRFGSEQPTIYALSGNTAVGKSFMSKKDTDFAVGLDENGEARGALNPDTLKALLRRGVDGVTNQQIHIEGFALNRKLAEELKSKALQTSMVIDERLGSVFEVRKLLDIAKKSGKNLVIKDIDAPLEVSALRVLGRDIRTDPCVPFGPIAGGYKAIRKDREDVIKLILESPEVLGYELYVMDESGRSALAAKKILGKDGKPSDLEILDIELFAYSLSGGARAEEDITRVKNAKVEEALFAKYKGKGVSSSPLEKYKGFTLEEALMLHSLELPKW